MSPNTRRRDPWQGIPVQERIRMRHAVMARDNMTCQHCLRRCDSKGVGPDNRPWHIDHVVPVCRGGPSIMENLCLSCAECNLKRARIFIGPISFTSHAPYPPRRARVKKIRIPRPPRPKAAPRQAGTMAQRRARGDEIRAHVLQAIADFETEEQRPATFLDIAKRSGITSMGTLAFHVRRLVSSGHVQKRTGTRCLSIATPLDEWHTRTLTTITALGHGQPVALATVAEHLLPAGPLRPDIHSFLVDVTGIMAGNLVRRGYVEQTGRGFVVITEPQT